MNLTLYTRFQTLTNKFKPGFKTIPQTLLIAILLAYSTPLFSQTIPATPTAVSASPATICQGNSTQLKATSVGNTIKWYASSNSTVSIGVSNSGAGFSVSPSIATTYYAQAVDAEGDTSMQRGSVSIVVNTVPTITSTPQDVNTLNDSGQCGAVIVYPDATASGIPAPTVLYSNKSGTSFESGTTTVLITAVNTCGNSSLSFDVTVMDNEPPVVIAPPDTTLTVAPGSSSVSNVMLTPPVVTDNCGVLNVTNDAPSTFPAGTTVVTWTATDNNGNTATATQNVIVPVTNMPPVISGITSSDADNTIAQNSSISLNVNWNDEVNGGPYTVSIDWRDSSALTVLSGISGYSASPSHTYTKTGVFSPVVIVTDGGNLSDTSIFKYIVVYVGGNYSTTADGSFTAPAGSLVSNPGSTLNNVSLGDQCKPGCSPGSFIGDVELNYYGAPGNNFNCPVLTHNCFTNFNASANPGKAATLWFNLHTQLCGQLVNNGDYILFSGGALAFNNIGTSFGTTAALPNGEIIADNTVSKPTTSFDGTTWITRVPLGYCSSDIFIAGAALPSSYGFTVRSGKSTGLTGQFSSDVAFNSSWFYGEACYKSAFTNSTVGTINSECGFSGKQAGTPCSQTANLVSGACGGGGSNYTGSYSSTDNFAASNIHFNFETENISWNYLAVSACYIAQFEGTGYYYPNGHKNGCNGGCHGRCNPTSDQYGILVVQTDKFNGGANGNMIRVKIWDITTGSIIFDTQMGAPDDAMPTTPFNGNIKVRVPTSCVARMEAADVPAGTFETSVYPNPFQSVLNINVSTSSTSNIEMGIYDVVGRLAQSLTDILPNQPITIQNNLPNGMYFIHVKQDNNTQIIKMIKDNN